MHFLLCYLFIEIYVNTWKQFLAIAIFFFFQKSLSINLSGCVYDVRACVFTKTDSRGREGSGQVTHNSLQSHSIPPFQIERRPWRIRWSALFVCARMAITAHWWSLKWKIFNLRSVVHAKTKTHTHTYTHSTYVRLWSTITHAIQGCRLKTNIFLRGLSTFFGRHCYFSGFSTRRAWWWAMCNRSFYIRSRFTNRRVGKCYVRNGTIEDHAL